MGEISLREALYTTRAMRRLRPDPVSEEDLRFIVDAATQAPSGSNRQPWIFLVITDRETRRALGEIYGRLGERFIGERGLDSGRLPREMETVYRNAMRLARRMGDAPALVLACMRGTPPGDPASASAYWGSIYPVIQNLMLAARSRGLGTTLTTLRKAAEGEVKALLGIPDDVETVALIPVGHPEGEWGRPLRAPSSQVTYRDRWGRS